MNNSTALTDGTTGNSSNYSAGQYSEQERLLYGSLGLLLSAFITVVNSVIMWAFVRNRSVRRVPGHVLIVGLMVSSDILIGATALPGYLAATLFEAWPLPLWLCDLWITCDYISTNVSVVSVTAVAFDRFLATNCVFAHKRWMHRTNQIRLCIGLWVFTALRNVATFPAWVLATNFRATADPASCSHPIYKNPTAALVQRTLALYIPVILLVFFYAAVVFRILRSSGVGGGSGGGGGGGRSGASDTLLRRHVPLEKERTKQTAPGDQAEPAGSRQSQSPAGQSGPNSPPKTGTRHCSSAVHHHHRTGTLRRRTLAGRLSKSFRIVTCVLVSFLLANLPWHILDNMIMMKKTQMQKTDSVYILSWIMCYMNAFLNPFFYLFMNDEYKKVLLGVFRCQGTARRNDALVHLRGLMSNFTRANVALPASNCDSLSDLETNQCTSETKNDKDKSNLPLSNAQKSLALVTQYVSSV